MDVNGAIGRLGRLFAILFAVLAARQVAVQVFPPAEALGNPLDPRSSLLTPDRGAILARDGTVLARSTTDGRIYPLGRSAAHVVGYVSPRYGVSGLEASFDAVLRARSAARDPLTQLRAVFDPRASAQVRGATVVTTIDPAVQTELATELARYGRAAGVALDPRTGQVLAVASVPSFDPGVIDAEMPALLADAERSPLVDRALDGLYPPGSSFKIVTAADGLAAGTITPSSTFDDPGHLAVGDAVIHDDESEATGEQDLAGAFALSSNVDFARIALGIGRDRWFDDAAAWRLGDVVRFELPVSRDRLPKRSAVTDGVLAQLGFGQADLLVTPMRMALVAATIASGGDEPRPYVVAAVRRGGAVETNGPSVSAQPVSSDVAAQVRELMVQVVARGTGTAAALPGVAVAGKTGTATLATGAPDAWFVAFAPAAAPRVAVAVLVEHAGYGGAVAAPIAKHVLAFALRSPEAR